MNRYLIAAVVTLLVVLGLYRWGYHNGWSTRDAEMQAVIAQKNEESRQKEQVMAEQLNACIDAYNQVREQINGQR